jgi:hypothetical protein
MSKNSKKRTKKYAGWDARQDDSVVRVHKVTAIKRSPLRQWLFEHKKLLRIVVIVACVVIIIVLAFVVTL